MADDSGMKRCGKEGKDEGGGVVREKDAKWKFWVLKQSQFQGNKNKKGLRG